MMILPTTEPDAKKLLHLVAAQRSHCTAIVFGNTEEARQAASRADVRAEGHPFRKVVWIPEPSVLKDEPLFAPLLAAAEAGATTAFLTFSFEIAMHLVDREARRFIPIELAFIAAERGVA